MGDAKTARAARAPELDVLRKRTVCASTVESVDRKMAADAAAAAPMPITNWEALMIVGSTSVRRSSKPCVR